METGNGWYTWNKKCGGEYIVVSCLDRFLVSENIVHDTVEIMADMLPAAGNDHWPISLSWDWTCSTLRKPFIFEQFWMEHKNFKDIVHQWWQELVPTTGTAMLCFQQKLKMLKAKIRTWNKEEFGNIFEDTKNTEF